MPPLRPHAHVKNMLKRPPHLCNNRHATACVADAPGAATPGGAAAPPGAIPDDADTAKAEAEAEAAANEKADALRLRWAADLTAPGPREEVGVAGAEAEAGGSTRGAAEPVA